MEGGGTIYDKGVEYVQEYTNRRETIDTILEDYTTLQRMMRQYPYLPVYLDLNLYRRVNLQRYPIGDLRNILTGISSQINSLDNLNDIVQGYLRLFESKTLHQNLILRRINDNYPPDYASIIIDCLIKIGVYVPPGVPEPNPFVYLAGVDHYAEARSRNSFADRVPQSYSAAGNMPSYNSRTTRTPSPPESRPRQSYCSANTGFCRSRPRASEPEAENRYTPPPRQQPPPQQQQQPPPRQQPPQQPPPPPRVYFPSVDEVRAMNVTDRKNIRKRHKMLSRDLHPDKGGDTARFQAMQAEYDDIKENIPGMKKRKYSRKKKKNTKKRSKRKGKK